MIIVISGTPGTGKTTLAKKLMKQLKYPLLDVKKFIKTKGLVESYDKKRKSDIIDIKKLNKELIKEINKIKKQHSPEGIIIDSHLSHYLPKKYVDFAIITKTNLKVLEKRLKKRQYSKAKIRENLDCEIFDICLNEAKVGSSYNYLKTCTMPDGTTGNNIECDTDLNSFKGKAELYYQYCSKYGCYWFKKETKYFTTTLTCPLPVCGDNIINQPDEICDGTDDDACQGQCKQDCTCPDDGCVIIKKTPDTARDDDGNTIHVATDNNQYERFYILIYPKIHLWC